MAFENPVLIDGTRKAGASLASSQFKFVKLNTSGEVIVCAAVTDVPYGVLQNAPASGEVAEVCVIGITKVQGDADLAKADLIGTSADGQAAAYVAGTDTTKYIVGQVLDDNAAAGGYATAVINCANPHRGA